MPQIKEGFKIGSTGGKSKNIATGNKTGITVSLIGNDEVRQMLAQMKGKVNDSIAKAIAEATVYVTNTARMLAPRVTRKLEKSITYQLTIEGDTAFARVGPTDDITYAKYVEYGTGPHTIVPVNKVLADKEKGIIYGKIVHHPGSKPHPFLFPALQRNMKKIKDLVVLSITEGYGIITRL